MEADSTGSVVEPTVADRIASLLGSPQEDTPEEGENVAPENTEADMTAEFQSSEESQDEQEPEEAEEAPEPRKFKVGDAEVTEDELLKGYLRQADYTKKTQAIAEARKAAEAELAQVNQERQRYAQALEYFSQQIPQAQPPNPALLESDPVEFLRQKEAYENTRIQHAALMAERQKVSQQMQAEMVKNHRAMLERENEAVADRIPEWRDAEKAKAIKMELASYLRGEGFADNELNTLVDHRTLLVARKAMLYDRMMAKQATVEKKVAKAPPVMKPGPAKGTDSKQERYSAARTNLRKSGHVDDAARALLALNRS